MEPSRRSSGSADDDGGGGVERRPDWVPSRVVCPRSTGGGFPARKSGPLRPAAGIGSRVRSVRGGPAAEEGPGWARVRAGPLGSGRALRRPLDAARPGASGWSAPTSAPRPGRPEPAERVLLLLRPGGRPYFGPPPLRIPRSACVRLGRAPRRSTSAPDTAARGTDPPRSRLPAPPPHSTLPSAWPDSPAPAPPPTSAYLLRPVTPTPAPDPLPPPHCHPANSPTSQLTVLKH